MALNFADALEAMVAGALDGVTLAGENILQVSNTLVPLEEGTLERSGKVTTDSDETSATAAISYNTPYAVIQHEDLTFHHAQGRQAKYLEQAATSQAQTTAAIVQTAIKRRLA